MLPPALLHCAWDSTVFVAYAVTCQAGAGPSTPTAVMAAATSSSPTMC